jgi:hypothetical protein
MLACEIDIGEKCMGRADRAIVASTKQRLIFAVAAAVMIALWCWSLVPVIENWGNPNEDGFSYVPVFWATVFCLPSGYLLLGGAIAGSGDRVALARTALLLGGGVILIVVLFLVFQHVVNSSKGLQKLIG